METILKWSSQYSIPVLVLICVGAALVFVLKLTTEQAIENQFKQHARELELKLERRSAFEQQVLLDRYKLVSEFAQRLQRITTDLNRASHGMKVEGLYQGSELVPLTAIFEDLSTKRFQLSDQFYQLFDRQARVVLSLANAKTAEERVKVEAEWVRGLDQLMKMANDQFGTDKVSW